MSRKNKKNKGSKFSLPTEIKLIILGVVMILAAIIISLSFFNKAGKAGSYFLTGTRFVIGDTAFLIPLILILGGLVFLNSRRDGEEFLEKRKKIFWQVGLACFILLLGLTGILGGFNPEIKRGGWLGYLLSWPLLKYFGFWATQIIFLGLVVIGSLIFQYFLYRPKKKKEKEIKVETEKEEDKSVSASLSGATADKPSIIKRIFAPKFRIKEVPPFAKESKIQEEPVATELKLENKPVKAGSKVFSYQPPPINLLEPDKGAPNSGDTRVNSAVIKKTLQNFNIEVTMSEINIGPTVTQYTFKPAEGVKLSKITGLSNDLALALASHPIRIEAPIPGRSLVGIEVPNKGRAEVRLRNLIENDNFQKSPANLLIALGRDVSGLPVYTDLTKMPHLLVAGATGTGKTIFLNSLILSLLYQPSNSIKSAGPEMLRLILVDPKRVEFPVYSNLPHLLCPVIYNANQTLGALRWLTLEMERRFDVLVKGKSRDIGSFNEKAIKGGTEPLPYIIVIIDELADLMAAKGREIEASIVRLAQMSRAVGIHLVVATQRPSVEVITGLIKANITSRVTFQVASQVDSRTVLDTAGAEKLLGRGDMLYISAYTPKPKRIQASYISEKEVKKVITYIADKAASESEGEMNFDLIEELEKTSEDSSVVQASNYDEDDPLLEEAKKLVIEANKASASYLQRRLRLGYARAARLIDILEEKGIVGPADGSKPREVYGEREAVQAINPQGIPVPPEEEPEDSEEPKQWEKV
jgi:S-DNA-T family DNA segregation ATPase FtsK/SpoIIIE